MSFDKWRQYVLSWVIAAIGSAVFAGLVSILGKLGIATTDSDVATAIRTIVVLVMAWIIVAIQGNLGDITHIEPRSWVFLTLSGLATCGSWICYFKALSLGDVNKVVPIDKSSAALASLLAIVLFSETDHLLIKLACIAAILAGTFMMIERKETSNAPAAPAANVRPKTQQTWSWLIYAVLAAVFAACTSILGKVGIDGVDSNLGTAIRTVVVLVMAWVIVFAKGKAPQVHAIERCEMIFLVLSGIATGASWLCYYFALQNGIVSVVVQIDKLSLLVSVAVAFFVFHERLTRKSAAGLALLTVATAIMTAFAS